jgi:hypothetical protein
MGVIIFAAAFFVCDLFERASVYDFIQSRCGGTRSDFCKLSNGRVSDFFHIVFIGRRPD